MEAKKLGKTQEELLARISQYAQRQNVPAGVAKLNGKPTPI